MLNAYITFIEKPITIVRDTNLLVLLWQVLPWWSELVPDDAEHAHGDIFHYPAEP